VRTMLARVLGVRTDERAWRLGARGEQTVAKQLAKLEPLWRVLHDVPVGDRHEVPVGDRAPTSTTWFSVRPACSASTASGTRASPCGWAATR
jgi:hypothetical protein